MIAKRSGYALTASSAITSSRWPQLGGWMTAASTPPSSIRAIASAALNSVTCRWA